MIRRLAIWITALKLLAFLTLEVVLRLGFWARYMNHDLPDYITASGIAWVFVTIYILWLLVEPVIIGIALIAKDRGFLLEHSA